MVLASAFRNQNQGPLIDRNEIQPLARKGPPIRTREWPRLGWEHVSSGDCSTPFYATPCTPWWFHNFRPHNNTHCGVLERCRNLQVSKCFIGFVFMATYCYWCLINSIAGQRYYGGLRGSNSIFIWMPVKHLLLTCPNLNPIYETCC